MPVPTEVLTVEAPVPLDLLLYRRFKREVPGLVEQTLDANYGLADLGPILPRGTQVTVTLPTASTAVKKRPFVSLTA